jgi:hypothetical protein
MFLIMRKGTLPICCSELKAAPIAGFIEVADARYAAPPASLTAQGRGEWEDADPEQDAAIESALRDLAGAEKEDTIYVLTQSDPFGNCMIPVEGDAPITLVGILDGAKIAAAKPRAIFEKSFEATIAASKEDEEVPTDDEIKEMLDEIENKMPGTMGILTIPAVE